MAATPIYGFPYPGLSDSPNGPSQVQALATAVETTMAVVQAQATATHYGDGGTYASDTQNVGGTTTSGAFTATLTGGTACGVAFVAPASGKVDIINVCETGNSNSANLALCSIEVKTGATIGSGSVVLAAGNAQAIYSGATVRGTGIESVSGLTPGASYNVQQKFAVTGTTGSYASKRLMVRPAA